MNRIVNKYFYVILMGVMYSAFYYVSRNEPLINFVGSLIVVASASYKIYTTHENIKNG